MKISCRRATLQKFDNIDEGSARHRSNNSDPSNEKEEDNLEQEVHRRSKRKRIGDSQHLIEYSIKGMDKGSNDLEEDNMLIVKGVDEGNINESEENEMKNNGRKKKVKSRDKQSIETHTSLMTPIVTPSAVNGSTFNTISCNSEIDNKIYLLADSNSNYNPDSSLATSSSLSSYSCSSQNSATGKRPNFIELRKKSNPLPFKSQEVYQKLLDKEEDPEQIKKIKNRQAANKSRRKKQEYYYILEKEMKQIKHINQELSQKLTLARIEVKTLTEQNSFLKQMMLNQTQTQTQTPIQTQAHSKEINTNHYNFAYQYSDAHYDGLFNDHFREFQTLQSNEGRKLDDDRSNMKVTVEESTPTLTVGDSVEDDSIGEQSRKKNHNRPLMTGRSFADSFTHFLKSSVKGNNIEDNNKTTILPLSFSEFNFNGDFDTNLNQVSLSSSSSKQKDNKNVAPISSRTFSSSSLDQIEKKGEKQPEQLYNYSLSPSHSPSFSSSLSFSFPPSFSPSSPPSSRSSSPLPPPFASSSSIGDSLILSCPCQTNKFTEADMNVLIHAPNNPSSPFPPQKSCETNQSLACTQQSLANAKDITMQQVSLLAAAVQMQTSTNNPSNDNREAPGANQSQGTNMTIFAFVLLFTLTPWAVVSNGTSASNPFADAAKETTYLQNFNQTSSILYGSSLYLFKCNKHMDCETTIGYKQYKTLAGSDKNSPYPAIDQNANNNHIPYYFIEADSTQNDWIDTAGNKENTTISTTLHRPRHQNRIKHMDHAHSIYYFKICFAVILVSSLLSLLLRKRKKSRYLIAAMTKKLFQGIASFFLSLNSTWEDKHLFFSRKIQ